MMSKTQVKYFADTIIIAFAIIRCVINFLLEEEDKVIEVTDKVDYAGTTFSYSDGNNL